MRNEDVEEEEQELFPKVEKALGEEKLAQLGTQMKRRFAEVLEEGFEAAVPRGFAKTSAEVSRKMMNKRRAA